MLSFSPLLLNFTFLIMSSMDSFSTFIFCSSTAFILARDYTSYAMLTWSLYNAFMGILDNTMLSCAKYFNGVYVAVSSMCNMLFVTLNIGLA
jgi:hypothetical protein